MNRLNIAATIILLVLDFIWIGAYMKPRYGKMVTNIQGNPMTTNSKYAVVAYTLMILGLNIFVLPNIRKGHELEDSLKYGFGFGVVVYGVYAFTAAAIFRDWSLQLSIADTIWGGMVYFLASYLSTKIILN